MNRSSPIEGSVLGLSELGHYTFRNGALTRSDMGRHVDNGISLVDDEIMGQGSSLACHLDVVTYT